MAWSDGLRLWFKADTLSLNDGDDVTSWPCSAGSGDTLVHPAPAGHGWEGSSYGPPKYRAADAEANNLPSVEFIAPNVSGNPGVTDSAMGVELGTAITSPDIYWVKVVHSYRSSSGFCSTYGTSYTENFLANSSGNEELFYSLNGANAGIAYSGPNSQYLYTDILAYTNQLAILSLLARFSCDARLALCKDGVSLDDTSSAYGSPTSYDSQTLDYLNLATFECGSFYLSEMLIWESIPSDSDLISMYQYLASKYSITVSNYGCSGANDCLRCCTHSPRTFAPSTEAPSTKSVPVFKTVCDFKGQIVIGNIITS